MRTVLHGQSDVGPVHSVRLAYPARRDRHGRPPRQHGDNGAKDRARFTYCKVIRPTMIAAAPSPLKARMLAFRDTSNRREPERRAIGRTRIDRDALLFFHGQADVFPCCVRDVTNSGAGIRLEGLNVLPAEFYLSFDRFRTVRQCRLIWRETGFVGAAFEDNTVTRPKHE